MRYPADHCENTRQKILAAAGRVFRRQGFHAGGISDVMQEAGLTKGAFSAYFSSKEELLAETIVAVLDRKVKRLFASGEGYSGKEWVKRVVAHYLSYEHLEDVEDGCPVPALFSELVRAGERSRQVFLEKMREGAKRYAAHLSDSKTGTSEEKAWAILSMCFGAMTLARSTQDQVLARQIIDSARTVLLNSL